MINAFFHRKGEEEKPYRVYASENHPYLLKEEGVLSNILSLSKNADYEGSFDVNDEPVLMDASHVSMVTADGFTYRVVQSTRSSIPANTALVIRRVETFVRAFCLDLDWKAYLERLGVLIAQELSGNPGYLYLDVSKTRSKTNEDVLLSFVAYVFLDDLVLVYAPGVKNASGTPVLALSETQEEKPAEAPEASAKRTTQDEGFAALIDDLCGIAEEEKEEPISLSQQEMAKPAIKKSSEKKEKKPSAILPFLKAEGSNLAFILAFLVLAFVTPFVYFGFSSSNQGTFFYVCVIMVFLFLLMSGVPVGFLLSDLRAKRFEGRKIFLAVTVILPILAEVLGIILHASSRAKGWESGKALPFSLCFFLFPVYYGIYLSIAWFVSRKKNKK